MSHLLLLDSDIRARRRVPALLAPLGYDVLVARNLKGALRALGTHTPEAMLVDATSRRIDGIDAVYRLRQLDSLRDVPVLLFTSAHDPALRRLGVEAGCSDFLTKPIEEMELVKRVDNYASQQREKQQARRRLNVHLRELREQIAALKTKVAGIGRADRMPLLGQEIAIERLAQAAELRDDSTGQHAKRVSEYCKLLSLRVGFDEPFAEMMRVSSPLHDVGKLAIPDRILLKRGQLTDGEFEVVKQHPWMGFDMLSDTGSPLLDMAASIALTHHEKYDGSGYPYGLKGDDIPIEGRITAIADVFDALTSHRCYKPAYPLHESLAIMRAGRGTHFDPHLLDLFIGSVDRAQAIQQQYAN